MAPPGSASTKALGWEVVALAVLGLGAAAVVLVALDLEPFRLMRDPASISGLSPAEGLISNLGAMLWMAAAAVAALGGLVVGSPDPRGGRFLLIMGGLSLGLGLDDLFLIHEHLAVRIPEEITFGIYGAAILVSLLTFRAEASRSPTAFLVIAVSFFALSFGVDMFQDSLDLVLGQWRIFAEDGAKFLGISSWFAWLMTTAIIEIRRHQAPPSSDRDLA